LDVEQVESLDKPARKQQQRSIVTQQKLLDSAIEAFSENGFEGTSTRDIADRAGVHHPLITYHFKNKDKLWRAACDKVFREFNISLVKAMAEIPDFDPKAKAEAFIRSYLHHSRSQPALHRIILQEANCECGRLTWLSETHLKPLFEEVDKSLVSLQKIGVVPAGSTALLFNMIRVCAGGLIALKLELKETSNIDLDCDDQIAELADLIIRVFFPGDQPEPD
jgi:TetR/AcrR family transcriptional regulator